MSSLPRILNHLIWMSDGQVMAKKKKKHGFKKTDNISPKTQHFLYTKFSSIEDHNQTKQPFQTRILHKKRYSKPPNKYPYKIHTKVPNKFHTLISSSSLLFFFFFFFFLFFFFFFFFFSSLLFSLLFSFLSTNLP